MAALDHGAEWHGPRGRGRRLIRPLAAAQVTALALAVGGAAIPGGTGEWAGRFLLAVLVGASIGRIVFLAQRWWRLGDHRFAAVALLLLAVIAFGTVAALTR